MSKSRIEVWKPHSCIIVLSDCSAQPQYVIAEIADVSQIADYRLKPAPEQNLYDLYFDTPSEALKAKKMSLRLREIDEATLLTLKGPSRRTDWGGVNRREIELVWGSENLMRILAELRACDIHLSARGKKHQPTQPPLECLLDRGLQVIQDRTTRRQIRNIVAGEGNGEPILAELALDSVVYRFNDAQVKHYEVEIESKNPGGVTAVKDVLEALQSTYKNVLRLWDYSKLATGEAIKKLLAKFPEERLLDQGGNIRPEGYDRIETMLRKH
ncbi:MAG: CYTH domain-containing protein [bacterium]